MLEFAKETLTLLPFLFVTYLVLEAVEAHAGGALSRWLERARSVGPLAGALAGAYPSRCPPRSWSRSSRSRSRPR